MSYILIYMITIGSMQYTLLEPMISLSQCRRIADILETSESVIDVKCAAIILDKERK